jgi:bifunctional DNA-binding transcriptional regulator/antitoxin component of YhaV-PrlF toxin-antitoxin module
MTAKMNRRGQLVLQTAAHEKLDLRSGDALVVVVHDADGRIVLQKRTAATKKTRSKTYLNPRPLPASVLEGIYQHSDPEWDKIEAEAVAAGRRALTGNLLKDL